MKYTNYKYVGHRIISRVFNEKLWKTLSEDETVLFESTDRIRDIKRVIEIAKQEIPIKDNVVKMKLPNIDILSEGIISQVREFIDYGNNTTLISEEMIALAARCVDIGKVEIVDSGFKGGANLDLRYNKSDFPSSPEEMQRIQINIDLIKSQLQHLKNCVIDLKFNANYEDLLQICLGEIGVHEWSHSLERSFSLLCWETIKSISEYNHNEHILVASKIADRAVFLITQGVVVPVLKNFKDNRNVESYLMHGERFATGFQKLVSRHLMTRLFGEVKGSKLLEKHWFYTNEKLEDFNKLRNDLQITDSDISTLAYDIRDTLRNGGLDFNYIPLLFEDLGYLSPYSEEEIKLILKEAYSFVTDKIRVKRLFERELQIN